MEVDSEHLRKTLRKRLNDLADTVAGGACKDYAEYRSLCGKIEGIAIAERDLLDMIETKKKIEGEEDE